MKKAYTEKEVLEALRKRLLEIPVTHAAREIGISHPFLIDMRDEHRHISDKVANWLGFERNETTFRKVA